MATISGNFPELLETRQKEIFFKNFTMQDQKFKKLFTTHNSTKSHEDRMRVAGLGTFQVKPEGSPVGFSDPIEGDRVRKLHMVYALGYRNTREAVMDDQWDILNRMPADLGESGRDHHERVVWDLLNDAFVGTRHTGLDGLALFATHTSLRPEVSASWAAATDNPGQNFLSPPVALSQTGIEDMMTMAMVTQSEEGRFVDMSQQILLIHPRNKHKADVLLETQQKPGSADNDINTVVSSRSGLTVLAVPYLTNQTGWSIHDGPGKNSLQWNNRESMNFSRAKDADTFDEKHYASYRGSVMFSEWRGNWGSNFV